MFGHAADQFVASRLLLHDIFTFSGILMGRGACTACGSPSLLPSESINKKGRRVNPPASGNATEIMA
jgi:hypothetical protein